MAAAAPFGFSRTSLKQAVLELAFQVTFMIVVLAITIAFLSLRSTMNSIALIALDVTYVVLYSFVFALVTIAEGKITDGSSSIAFFAASMQVDVVLLLLTTIIMLPE